MLLNEIARPFVVLELAALGLLLIAKLLPILPSEIVWLIFSLLQHFLYVALILKLASPTSIKSDGTTNYVTTKMSVLSVTKL